MRIHVLGGSGSGTTTLARAVAAQLGVAQLDTDDFYWLPTAPPFRQVRPVQERLSLLLDALDALGAPGWTLSGSLCGWGDAVIPRLQLVVHLDVPADVRVARLRLREAARYGSARVSAGGDMHAAHLAFLDWAASYDDPAFSGRSRAMHMRWLARLPCPVLRLDGQAPAAALVTEVLREVTPGA